MWWGGSQFAGNVWIGATTVGEVISLVARETAFKATQPTEFLQKNNNFNPADFLDKDGDIDFDKVTEWENSLHQRTAMMLA